MVTGVRIEDLPPAMQAQVREKLGEPERRKRDRRNAALTRTDGWCWACGEHFTSTTKWERHSDETGHGRFELIQQPEGAPS